MRLDISRLIKKTSIYLLIALAVFAGSLIVYAFRTDTENEPFTSYNTGKTGVKALYRLTGEMGYAAERFNKPARFLPEDAVLVTIEPSAVLMNEPLENKYLKKWVESGNTMILVGSLDTLQSYSIVSAGELPPVEPGFENELVFRLGRGRLIFIDNAEALTNRGLELITPAVEFVRVLDMLGKRQILFNEYYHGIADSKPLFLEIIGKTWEIMLVQLLLAIAALMLSRLRRFGRPAVVFENIKRKENENLFALSNIYSRVKAGPEIVEACLEDFKTELGSYLGLGARAEVDDIIRAAEGDRLLSKHGVRSLINSCDAYLRNGGRDAKRMLTLISGMDRVRKEIRV